MDDKPLIEESLIFSKRIIQKRKNLTNTTTNTVTILTLSVALSLFLLGLLQIFQANQDTIKFNSAGSFEIKNDQFYLDGKPFRIISGSIHYFRIVPEYWRHRLQSIRAMGLNTIMVYVPWNFHETNRGKYDFTGDHDLISFLKMAQELQLFVLLRPGPYICAEWDFGGIPAWTLENGTYPLRTYDPNYINYATTWLNKLLPMLKELLYVETGGPILMVQLENEFGSFGNVEKNPRDLRYMQYLKALNRKHLGSKVQLFTTDGVKQAKQGTLLDTDILTLVDGCKNIASAVETQAFLNPQGMSPFLCSETYTGWITHWGQAKLSRTTSTEMQSVISSVLAAKGDTGSVSLYMAHGGTNFGFWSGSNWINKTFLPDITSYDYNAPIAEGGDRGIGSDGKDKFEILREVFGRMLKKEFPPEPPLPPRFELDGLEIDGEYPLLEGNNLQTLSTKTVQKRLPVAAETFGCYFGFVSYQAAISLPKGHVGELIIPRFQDRVHVFLNNKHLDTLSRNGERRHISLSGQGTLTLLVEHMGRINFDPVGMKDTRVGILSPPLIDGRQLEIMWTIRCHDFSSASLQFGRLKWRKRTIHGNLTYNDFTPTLFRSTFQAPTSADTYLNLDGWGKGVAWVNGFNIGRYWNANHPQHTLFIPGPRIHKGRNTIVILELDASGRNLVLQDKPHFD